MRELIRTNDPVEISWLIALLAGEGIEAVVMDNHMAAVDGSISAIPRRVMVAEDDFARAERILREAGQPNHG